MSDRVIRIPEAAMAAAAHGSGAGRALHVPVVVDWPELQLTETEIVTNAVARASGMAEPFPDRSIITIELPYVYRR